MRHSSNISGVKNNKTNNNASKLKSPSKLCASNNARKYKPSESDINSLNHQNSFNKYNDDSQLIKSKDEKIELKQVTRLSANISQHHNNDNGDGDDDNGGENEKNNKNGKETFTNLGADYQIKVNVIDNNNPYAKRNDSSRAIENSNRSCCLRRRRRGGKNCCCCFCCCLKRKSRGDGHGG